MIEIPTTLEPLLVQGDILDVLPTLPERSIHVAVTSPPYLGLRRYDVCPCAMTREIVSGYHTREPTETDSGGGILHNVFRPPDPNCPRCHGTGSIPEVAKGRIWGGDPQHVHTWQEIGARRTRKVADVKNPDSKQATSLGSSYEAPTSLGCSCGAWKGNLGNEPEADCLAWARREAPCPRCYVCHIRTIAAGLWPVLRDDGSFWLNIGDSFWASSHAENGLKPKDLTMVPARVALALQTDGWYLRSDTIFGKKNPMPESIQDRPTRAHEFVYLLTKKPRYFYDVDGFKEPLSEASVIRLTQETFDAQRGGG